MPEGQSHLYANASLPPAPRLRQMLAGTLVTHVIAAAADLKLPDSLLAAPQTAEELSQKLNIPLEPLQRMLRVLAALDIVRQGSTTYVLTDLGKLLCSEVEGSLREVALTFGSDAFSRSAAALATSLKAGAVPHEYVFGESHYDRLARDPELNAQFQAHMATYAGRLARLTLSHYDFATYSTICDVGGGYGVFLGTILAAYPGVSGVVFDLPSNASLADHYLREQQLADRCRFVGGSFFDGVPEGAQLYLLVNVLHGLNDRQATDLLDLCRAALPEHGRILILEQLIPADQDIPFAVLMSDLTMLITEPGRERSLADLQQLVGTSGLTPVSVQQIKAFTALEVRRNA